MEGPSGEAELPLLTVKHELRNGERAGPGVAGAEEHARPGLGKTRLSRELREFPGTGREISVAGGKEAELEYKGRSVYDGGGEGPYF